MRSIQLIVFLAALALGAVEAFAQQSTPPLFPAQSPDGKRESNIGSIEDEMLARRALKSADKAHKENLERAQELAALCSALNSNFKTANRLDKDDFKKLERAEKLTKKIREAAGGSEDEVEMERRPADVGAALAQFAEVAESLRDRVESTPKHVVSTSVIDEANVLLELIRLVRLWHPKT